jgi:tRNA C32,U32 (ribose-2'-O)-methylase TrmJ
MSHSVDSLNVASAAAVALYALRAPAVAAGQTSQRRPPSGDA